MFSDCRSSDKILVASGFVDGLDYLRGANSKLGITKNSDVHGHEVCSLQLVKHVN